MGNFIVVSITDFFFFPLVRTMSPELIQKQVICGLAHIEECEHFGNVNASLTSILLISLVGGLDSGPYS